VSATDAMLARFDAEVEERTTFVNGLIAQAEERNRDLTAEEMAMIGSANERLGEIAKQAAPLREGARIQLESRARRQELHQAYQAAAQPLGAQGPVEYRTAGAYIADLYYGTLGDREAQHRLEVFNRVAAHQTTADNPGLLPETIVSPIVNFIEVARPLVNTLGPTDLGTGAWSYARVTQHTQVGLQAGEKTELASRKMLITKTPLGADTYGGYVNVSKQDIARTSPGILDMVITDLAQQYAIETEEACADVLFAAATAGPVIPTGTPTPAAVASAVWAAAGQVFAATKGQGRTVVAVSPDMLGVIGPIFPPINPTNGWGGGFSAGSLDQGDQGNIAGLSVIMSAGLDTGQILVYSTAAAKAFEYRYGNLQVVEPSVWGVQVGYAGDFDAVVIEPAGVVKITKTP
jgi:HK97 family phage major capsid protein